MRQCGNWGPAMRTFLHPVFVMFIRGTGFLTIPMFFSLASVPNLAELLGWSRATDDLLESSLFLQRNSLKLWRISCGHRGSPNWQLVIHETSVMHDSQAYAYLEVMPCFSSTDLFTTHFDNRSPRSSGFLIATHWRWSRKRFARCRRFVLMDSMIWEPFTGVATKSGTNMYHHVPKSLVKGTSTAVIAINPTEFCDVFFFLGY